LANTSLVTMDDRSAAALRTLASRREARVAIEDVDAAGAPLMTAERLRSE
jgi:hypothetical protein